MPSTVRVAPFALNVTDSHLDDLRRRLDTARCPVEIADAGWDYGTEQAFLKTVIDHWIHRYDWRSTESEVNSLGSFTTQAAGQRVHFLHARSDGEAAIPLVLTHGWPGSIVEFFDAIPCCDSDSTSWRYRCPAMDSPGRRMPAVSTSPAWRRR